MNNQIDNKIMKEKKGNKVTSILIFLGICIISFSKFILKMDFSDANTTAESIGYLCGGVLGGCLLVFGITALIHKISKKDKKKILLIVSFVYLMANFGAVMNQVDYRKEKREKEYAKIRLAEEKMSSIIAAGANGDKIIKENITFEKYGEK